MFPDISSPKYISSLFVRFNNRILSIILHFPASKSERSQPFSRTEYNDLINMWRSISFFFLPLPIPHATKKNYRFGNFLTRVLLSLRSANTRTVYKIAMCKTNGHSFILLPERHFFISFFAGSVTSRSRCSDSCLALGLDIPAHAMVTLKFFQSNIRFTPWTKKYHQHVIFLIFGIDLMCFLLFFFYI